MWSSRQPSKAATDSRRYLGLSCSVLGDPRSSLAQAFLHQRERQLCGAIGVPKPTAGSHNIIQEATRTTETRPLGAIGWKVP
jgi:hypothetical protein